MFINATRKYILFTLCLFIHISCISIEASDLPFVVRNIEFVDDTNHTIKVNNTTMKTKTGDQLNSENLVHDLEELKLINSSYANITVHMDPIENSKEVNLRFQFQRRRMVASVRIIIQRHIEEPEKILHQLTLKRGEQFSGRLIETDIKNLTIIFKSLGHPKVKIETVQHNDPDDDYLGHVEYHVTSETKKVRIYDVKFSGNQNIESSTLDDLPDTQTRSFFLASRPVFDIQKLHGDEEKIINHYKEEGFFDVSIKSSWKLKDKDLAKIYFEINEGERFKVNKIYVSGNYKISLEKISEITSKRSLAYYSDKKWRQTLQDIRDLYGKNGYLQAQVEMTYDKISGIVSVFIKENEQFTVEDIKFEGLVKLKQETAMLDVKLEKNKVANTDQFNEVLNKLKSTGYYEVVNLDIVPTSENSVQVIFNVQEARNHVISFGINANQNGSLSGNIGYSHNNLFNLGYKFSLTGMYSEEVQRIGLAFTNPHVLGSDWELINSISYENEDNENYNDERIRARVMLEKAINKNLNVGIGLRFEFVDIEDLSQELAQKEIDASGNGTIIGLVSKFSYKTEILDTSGDVKEGIRISMAMLPSYHDEGMFIKMLASMRGTINLGENSSGSSHTLQARMTIGYASTKTPFHEKNYAGGVGTLRGYKRKSIAGENNNGGKFLLSSSVAYAFPIYKNRIKGVTFLEAAAVGDNLKSSDFLAVGGIGIRANLRDTFLRNTIEAGIAIPLNGDKSDHTKPFYFIFGDYDPAYDL